MSAFSLPAPTRRPSLTEWMLISPDIAKQHLDAGSNIRKINDDVVKSYADDMIMGNWQPVPVAICFNNQGILVNGQHRLAAVVKSGNPQMFLVAYGVEDATIAAMDVGLKRSISVQSELLGHKMSTHASSAVRLAVFGITTGVLVSTPRLVAAYLKYKDAIDFACDCAHHYTAPVRAALARAYVYNPNKIHRLKRMTEIMREHNPDFPCDGDKAAWTLRSNKQRLSANGNAQRLETYLRAEWAIQKFLDHQDTNSLNKNPVEKMRCLPE